VCSSAITKLGASVSGPKPRSSKRLGETQRASFVDHVEPLLSCGDQLVEEDPVDVVGSVEVMGLALKIDQALDLSKRCRRHVSHLCVDASCEMLVEPGGLLLEHLRVGDSGSDEVEEDQSLGGLLVGEPRHHLCCS
jgi:hypothetical protein